MSDPAPIGFRDGSLEAGGLRVADLARRFGTPLYVYAQAAIERALDDYEAALAGRDHLVCYAVKANPSLALLQLVARRGAGFDIVSAGELERVLAAGGEPSRIVFSGVGKTDAELVRALEAGIGCFNVESDGELGRLSAAAVRTGREAPVSLRVNPDVDARTHAYISTGLSSNKFGIPHTRARDTFRRAAGLPGLRVVGIDCHIGSQITEAAPFVDAADRVLDLVEAVERDGIAIHHLDFGGGLGIRYGDERPPGPQAMLAPVLARVDARGHGHRRVLVEPGRSIVGEAGLLACTVIEMKTSGSKRFCIVDAGMNDLIRPALYEAWMPIVATEPVPGAEPMACDVVGPVCESGDWLGRDRTLAVRAGDVVAVLAAGAYAMSMASTYNSRPRPAEVLVGLDGTAHLVRERDSFEDLRRNERLLP